MRFACMALAVFGAACGDDGGGRTCEYNGHVYTLGDTFPSDDHCNECSCTPDGVTCTARACAPDDAGTTTCGPSGGCTSGPACGELCCHAGERCDNGVCMCGGGPACENNDTCASAGPTGEDNCGATCCGQSGPCPL
jgi:hypothetical protein